MSRILLLTRRKAWERQKGIGNCNVCRKTQGAVITNTDTASSAEKQENSVKELTGTIKNRPYSVLSDNSLIKSVEFARRCNELGVEARVVLCLAMFQLRVPILNSKMPIIGLHFYVDALGKQYEISYFYNNERQNVPEVLTRLGRFRVTGSKPA